MPVLSRQDIPASVRHPHEEAYRKQLRESLLDPSLSDGQVQRIKQALAGIGKPKEYRADDLPPPGAIDPAL